VEDDLRRSVRRRAIMKTRFRSSSGTPSNSSQRTQRVYVDCRVFDTPGAGWANDGTVAPP
jgi:hypothetical protein